MQILILKMTVILQNIDPFSYVWDLIISARLRYKASELGTRLVVVGN